MNSNFLSGAVMQIILIFIVILVPEFLEAQVDSCSNCPDTGKKSLAIMIAKQQDGTAQEWYDRLADTTYIDRQVEKNVEGVVAIGTLFVPFGRVFGWGSKAVTKGANLLKPLGLGSTGRTVAANLTEQLAMKEIMSNPSIGKILIRTMKDTSGRWNGWSKMSNKNAHGVEIHYNALWENGVIKAIDDFKFIGK